MKAKFERKYCNDLLKSLLKNVSNNRILEAISILIVSFYNCYPFVVWGGAGCRVLYYKSKRQEKYFLYSQDKPPPIKNNFKI